MQMRRTQHVTVQLFIHRQQLKLKTKDKEGDVTIEYYYKFTMTANWRIGRGIRRQ